MCNCIQEINEAMQRKHCAIYSVVEPNDNQSSHVRFRLITLAGEPSKHCRGDVVEWKYCPFCGEKILRERSSNTPRSH